MSLLDCNLHELQKLADNYCIRFDLIKVDLKSGCWVWTGRKNRNGYGRENGKSPVLHRKVYETLRGRIGADLVLDHLCRNRACCNPAHLEPVTVAENTRRGNAARMMAANELREMGAIYDAEFTCP